MMPNLVVFGLCDDVRSEHGNKMTLVGYCGQSMNFAVLPAVLPKICFFAQFDPLEGATRCSVRLISPSGQVLFEAPNLPVSRPLAAPEGGPSRFRHQILIFQVAPIAFNEVGECRMEYDFGLWPAFATSFFISLDLSLQHTQPV
jgi:hypothetical protein